MSISYKTTYYKRLQCYLTLLATLFILPGTGCSTLAGSATQSLASSLSLAILNSDDIDTVEQGLPAYLLLLDGLIENDSNSSSLLIAAAKLNSAYAGVFPQSETQAKKLSGKALAYARSAVCIIKKAACAAHQRSFAEFQSVIQQFQPSEVEALYTLGSTWATWIEVNKSDWNAIADIGHVQTIMEQVVALDEQHEAGSAHIYLGVLATLLPPAMGGKPELGRKHFQRAVDLSDNKNLMAKVTFAKNYARLVFEQELHDQLLQEVIKADANVPGFTLINTLAQKQARELLNDGDDYF